MTDIWPINSCKNEAMFTRTSRVYATYIKLTIAFFSSIIIKKQQ